MTDEAYGRTKSDGGKLKMKALAALAEGRDDAAFTAATFLREAARTEERALRLLVAPSREVRLGVAVERCACLVDALAPTAAARAWGEVVLASDELSPGIVEAYRSNLEPRYEALDRAFQEAIAAAPLLRESGFLVPAARDARRALKELDRLLASFPGEFELWYFRYQATFFGGDDVAAWNALEKARKLEPDNPFARGSELVLAPRVLPPDDAELRLDAAFSELRRSGSNVEADTFLCFAIACFTMANRSKRPRLYYERIIEAAELGAATRDDKVDAKPDLRVARALAKDLLEGRKPTLDAFYRAGRGDRVTRASAEERKDPIRLLTGHHRFQLAA